MVRRPAHHALASAAAAAAAVLVLGALGVASAESPSSPAVARTVSVEGVGTVPVPAQANTATADAAYREAMAKALADGQDKASYLAAKSGATPGAVDSILERGGYIDCSSPSSEYASYEGEQPDFGYGGPSSVGIGVAAPQAAAGAPSHISHRPKVRHYGRPQAKKATATSCNLTANVALVYAIA